MNISIAPGECFQIAKLSRAQIGKVYEYMKDNYDVGEDLDYALTNVNRWPFFGIDRRDRTTFTWRTYSSEAFRTDITDRLLAALNSGETTMQTQPFPVDSYVVPNGFRYSVSGSTEHRYGTGREMDKLESEGTVLKVTSVPTPERIRVVPTNSTHSILYHPTELRQATPEEITALEKTQVLHKGSVIKSTDRQITMIVVDPELDRDGDIRIMRLDGGTHSTYFRPSLGYTLLGRVMENGDFRPAAAEETQVSPSEWKQGQRVRYVQGDFGYITLGNEYTLIADSFERGGELKVRIIDNDGDRATYPASSFELVV